MIALEEVMHFMKMKTVHSRILQTLWEYLNADQNPMTSSISDYNNDGFQDIFITDFGVDSTATGLGPFRYKLFENQSGTSFIDQAAAKNLDPDVFGWGAVVG